MTQARSSQAGVTLVEVMMAMMIMALATTMVVMTMPQRPSPVSQEAEKLVETLDRAKRQAQVSGQTFGVRATRASYQVVRRSGGAWLPVAGALQKLPDGVSLQYVERKGEAEERPEGWPQVWFDPLGHSEAARFRVQARRESVDVISDAAGVTLESRS